MADHALVVGCDSYPKLDGGDLKGAVRDALAVRDWVCNPAGGGVAPENVTLLLSCSPLGAQVSPDEAAGPASRERLVEEVLRLVDLRDAGRLYFYFAGHGCRTDPLNPALSRDALVLHDFNQNSPEAGTAGVDELRSRLSQSAFREVVIVLDACRDTPYRQPFDLSRLGRDPRRTSATAQPRMFVFQASAPGESAAGTAHDGLVRGIFSRALTDGLAGTGTAKIFDDTAGDGRPYQVRWSSLCAYVADAVTGQTPRYFGEGDLVLASFAEGSFPAVQLEVGVTATAATPAELAALRLQVRYPDLAATDDGLLEAPGPAPVRVSVPPRRHRVSVRASQWAGRGSYDVYTDTAVTLELRNTAVAAPPPNDPSGGPESYWRTSYGLDGESPAAAAGGSGEDEPSVVVLPFLPVEPEVDLWSEDPAAVLELHDQRGASVARGVGSLSAGVPPGSYTAVLVSALGEEERRPVDIAVGELETLQLHGASPAGWPPRRGELAWGSPAAWVAGVGDLLRALAPADRGVVVVAAEPSGRAPARPALGPGATSLQRGGVMAETVSTGGPWHAIELGGARLRVPVLPRTVTSVVLASETTWVALYDLDILADERATLLLDRAQSLLAGGRHDAASAVLRQVPDADSSQVVSVLRGERPAPLLLARDVPAGNTHTLLGTGPWALNVDR